MQRDGWDSRSKGLHFFQDLTDLPVLSLHVFLDLEGGVEDRVGVLVGGLRTRVGGSALHVLADDDDAQEDQLQEGLTDPRDDRDRGSGLGRRRNRLS